MGLPAWGISLIIAGASMGAQYLLRPRFKQEPVDRGKLDDVRVTGSEYGTTIPRVFGRARLAGNIIWSSGVAHEVIEVPTGGGKGSPQNPAERTHVYTSNFAVAVCRPGSGEVVNWLRLWADSDLVVNNQTTSSGRFEAEDAGLSGGATVATDTNASGGEYVTNLGNGGQAVFNFSSIPDPTQPTLDPEELADPYQRFSFYYKCATDLTATIQFSSGTQTVTFEASADWTVKTIDVAGFFSGLTFKNASAAAPDLDQIQTEKYWVIVPNPTAKAYKFTPTYQITGNVNPNLAYPKDINNPSEYYNAELTYDANGKGVFLPSIAGSTIRFYNGTLTQGQDSAIVAWLDGRYGTGEGLLRCSGHRRIAYVLFEERRLKNGRVENFTFEIDCGSPNVNDVLETLFADVNLQASDYALTATNGLTQIGFVEHTNKSRRQLVEELERYHQFRIAEIDGKIKTVADTVTPITTIDADLLRGHNAGEEVPAFNAEVAIKEEHLLPRSVSVSIMNPNIEYHNQSFTASLFASVSSTERKEFTFPIVDTPQNARLTAEKLLLKEHSESKIIEFTGLPAMAKYSVGDVITIPLGDSLFINCRIEKKQMTLPIGLIKFSCVSVNPFTPEHFDDEVSNLSTKALQQYATYFFPRNSIVVPIVSEPISEKHRGNLGVYLAACGRGFGSSENIAVLREFDTDNFVMQFVADTPARVGICEDVLGNHSDKNTEDTTNVLDIFFFDEIELESVTGADLDRYPNLNLLRVGEEWIQFRTATAQSLDTTSPYRAKWRVSNLRRGRFNTQGEMSLHVADEYATHYTEAVKFVELDKDDIGETLTFKAVTNGQAEENGQIATFTFNPISAYSVTNGTTDRTFDANNVSINELADVLATVIDDLNL